MDAIERERRRWRNELIGWAVIVGVPLAFVVMLAAVV